MRAEGLRGWGLRGLGLLAASCALLALCLGLRGQGPVELEGVEVRGERLVPRLFSLEGRLTQSLVGGIDQDVHKIENDAREVGTWSSAAQRSALNSHLPTMQQILRERRLEHQLEAKHARMLADMKSNGMLQCGGLSAEDCGLKFDNLEIRHFLNQNGVVPRRVALAQVSQGAKGSGVSAKLQKMLSAAEEKNQEEKRLNKLLKENAELDAQNAKLLGMKKKALSADGPSAKGLRGQKAIQRQHTQHRAQGLKAHVDKGQIAKGHKTTSLVTPVDESTQGGPPGVPEYVPATVTAPPPGIPDFNGATATIANLPKLGFGPSVLDEEGVEQRGSFTVRKANPYGGIWLRVYGKMNHGLTCKLRGFRKLGGDFAGNTVFTGYQKEWTAKSSISTGIIPPGPPDNFDILTCRDLRTGEVQHFETFPTPSPGFFEDPQDPAFQDEYTR